jgi:hypothetical protein
MLQNFSPPLGIGTKQLLHLNAYWVKLERNLGKDLASIHGVLQDYQEKV